MAKIKFPNLSEYELKLSRLGSGSQEIVEKAIYVGAKIVADEVKRRIKALSSTTEILAMRAYRLRKPTYITDTAKRGLVDSFGITPVKLDNDGYYNVKLGFDGYNAVKTKTFPNGQPNQRMARAVESGSTAMIKQPFIHPAVSASKQVAEKAMADAIDEEIERMIK